MQSIIDQPGNRTPSSAGGYAPGGNNVVNDYLLLRGHLSSEEAF